MLRLIILSFFMSSTALANEATHVVGLEYSYSDINNDSSDVTADLNDIYTSHYALSYQYKVTTNISFGLGYLTGDSSHADGVLVDIFTDSKLDYDAIVLSATASYPVSKRNHLYLQVNALQYDYDVVDDNEVVYNEEGNDFGFSLGWMYQFDNGIGLKAGYEQLNFGKHIDIKGFNTGISYRF